MAEGVAEVTGAFMPYESIYIDADLKDFSSAVLQCLQINHDRKAVIKELQNMWTVPQNPNPVLPILSVRTGFDLFFRVMNFSPGSEVIMSAVNIPDMIQIVQHHKLHIVPLDISIETAAPKVELLSQLVSSRTVAIVIAHLFGKWSPVDEFIAFAKKRNLYVVEDCAEGFCGFDRLSHPQTDLALYSFGVIKFYTSFGGAIAKIKPELYHKMFALHETYRIQSQVNYLKKVLKYIILYLGLNVPTITKNARRVVRCASPDIDYKAGAVKMLRGFPDRLIERIREQPCGALLATMLNRQKSFSTADFCLQRLKGDYMASRLPPSLDVVGVKAAVNNYWLFPVIAENPDNLMYLLNALGVDCYRGATQLNLVEPLNGNPNPLMASQADHGDCLEEMETRRQDHQTLHTSNSSAAHIPTVNRQYPHEAKYLVDHVLYMPVNKLVPFHVLNRMLRAAHIAVTLDKSSGDEKVKVELPSKL